MFIATYLIIFTTLCLFILFLLSHKQRYAKTIDTKHKPSGTYHAVGIEPCQKACSFAIELHSQRFLSAEAPKFPLINCGYQQCQCKYIHHPDRRSGEDRRDTFFAIDKIHQLTDKRMSTGRRKDDSTKAELSFEFE